MGGGLAIGRRRGRDAGAGASATPGPKLRVEVGGLGPALAVTGLFKRLEDGAAALAGDPRGVSLAAARRPPARATQGQCTPGALNRPVFGA